MPQANVLMQVRTPVPTVSVIDIQGDITAAAEEALMSAITTAATPRTRAILLNCSGLEYMNSSGIGLLVTVLIRLNRQKQRLLACGLSEHYQNIFELTRLTDAIGVYPDETAALAAAV